MTATNREAQKAIDLVLEWFREAHILDYSPGYYKADRVLLDIHAEITEEISNEANQERDTMKDGERLAKIEQVYGDLKAKIERLEIEHADPAEDIQNLYRRVDKIAVRIDRLEHERD